MLKKSLFIGGIGLSLVVAWTIITDETVESKESNVESGVADTNYQNEDIVIVYDDEESSKSNNNQSKKENIREKYVEAQAFDKDRKYEISIINPNQTEREEKNYISINGKIDGKQFYIDVPLFLAQEDSNKVLLRIKNLETGEVQSVKASFLDLLGQEKQRHFMKIDSENIEEFEYHTSPELLP